MTRRVPIEQRFWSKVAKAGDDQCWLWTASTSKGYGSLWPDKEAQAKGLRNLGAHVFSYVLHHGPIPPGLCVLHSCDTPLCVNPKHLGLGTHLENAQQRNARGRHWVRPTFGPKNVGSANGHAKLTESDVSKIKAALTNNARGVAAALARQYGITPSIVSMIKTGRIWGHVG